MSLLLYLVVLSLAALAVLVGAETKPTASQTAFHSSPRIVAIETGVTDLREADTDWHELVLVTEGDEMRLSKLVTRHRSAGLAHPMKRWFSFLVPSKVWIDEVKIWKVKL